MNATKRTPGKTMKSNSLEIAMLSGVLSVMVGGCAPSADPQADGKPPVAKVTTRWKWTPKSMVGIPQGIIIEQIGEKVEASFSCVLEIGGSIPIPLSTAWIRLRPELFS